MTDPRVVSPVHTAAELVILGCRQERENDILLHLDSRQRAHLPHG